MAASETVISWTFVNWVTVFLMFISMLLVIALGFRLFHSAKTSGADES